ncbi:MAG TPA: hypothetical protein VK469_04805, partial [Candidatus Kapabacteria bacterium]|nr:hypothetical protein [Candidatus Kapabacteria bacterium]
YNRWLHVTGLGQRASDFLADPAGSKYRFKAQTNVDLRIQKDFMLGGKLKLGVLADVFNLFNAGTVTDVITEAGSSFNNTVSIMYPRRARVGLRLYF